MALPREPRQKMINMMYLVLTALLALNVSSEILNAFKTVNNSLQTTNSTVNNSTQTILASLTEKLSDSTTVKKAKIWQPKAVQVEGISKSAYEYIQGLKNRIIKEAGGDPNNPNSSYKEDNIDIATRIMVEEGEGKKLYGILKQYKDDVLKVDPAIQTEFEKSLQVDLNMPKSTSKGNNTWEAAYFRMVPTVAALTILSKFQNDVRTSENKIVAFCHEQVGKVAVRFDSYAPIIGQSSNYLMPGQELEITAGVGAFNSQAKPQITIGGSSVPLNADGVAKTTLAAGGMGNRSIPVTITFFDQDGVKKTYTENVEYTVGQANASIALDKMNVLYVGVDNPVSIAASGGGDDKVQVSITGGSGSIRKVGGGKYIARVGSVTDDCRITVSVDGKVAGASQFRVRTIPQAQAYIGGQPSGANIGAGAFRAQGGVGAGIKDFPFELSYTVASFTFTIDTDDGDIVSIPVTGNAFSAAARSAINQHVKNGKLVTIDDIRVTGPDGRTSKAPSLIYYIK